MAAGTRMVFVAGQEPEDAATGTLTGPGALAAQARQVFANLGAAQAAAGAKRNLPLLDNTPTGMPPRPRQR